MGIVNDGSQGPNCGGGELQIARFTDEFADSEPMRALASQREAAELMAPRSPSLALSDSRPDLRTRVTGVTASRNERPQQTA